MHIGLDAGNGHSLAPIAPWAPETPATLLSTFSSAWQGLRQVDPHIESLDVGTWDAHHAFPCAPDLSHDLPLRPPPVATPVEFTEIMAEVREAYERPPRVATPVEFTQILAKVCADRAARVLRSDGASWPTTSPHVPRAEQALTPAAFSAALVSVQTQSDRVTTNEAPRDASQDAARKGARIKVTGDLLRRIQALGTSGIKAMGGIGRIAHEYGISKSTLLTYVSPRGNLYPEARDRAAEAGQSRTGKVTVGLLRALEKMGAQRIKSKGGLRAIARQKGIPLRTLLAYVKRCGEPSDLGRARLLDDGDPIRRAAKMPVTLELLLSIQRLGENGIRAAGGLSALADRHNVFIGSLRCHINSKGVLGRRGKQMVNGELRARISKIPKELLRDIETLGPRRLKAAGGLAAVAMANHVRFDTLRSYIDCRGQLTPAGRVRLYGVDPSHSTRITPMLLKEILALGKDGIEAEGGLDALASKRGFAPHILRRYVTFGGKLKRLGRNRLARFESDNANAECARRDSDGSSNAREQA